MTTTQTETQLQEVTKEEWEQRRRSVIAQARKLAGYGDEDINYFYTNNQIASWRFSYLQPGAAVKYPRGFSKWTIRHFSPVDCSFTYEFSQTLVTCLLRSPDKTKHYISQHLPGFCPIHDLIWGDK